MGQKYKKPSIITKMDMYQLGIPVPILHLMLHGSKWNAEVSIY